VSGGLSGSETFVNAHRVIQVQRHTGADRTSILRRKIATSLLVLLSASLLGSVFQHAEWWK
jgi:hypothetical protein